MKLLFSNQWGIQCDDPSVLDYTNYWMGASYSAGVRALTKNKKDIFCEPLREHNKHEADAFCIWETPRVSTNDRNDERYRFILKSGKPIYAFLTEPPPVVPENSLMSNAIFYDKIFTWRTDLIDNYKYHPIRPMSFDFKKPSAISFPDRKLCVIIGHILSDIFTSSDAIYSKRKEVLDWFAQYHSDEIDLYGKQPYGIGRIKQYPFFKGATDNKRETLAGYKFSFCYENSRYDNYITEKLFDCLIAGCIPVYIGAPNVADYVPADCFIDPESFDSFEDLYDYMVSMTEDDYKRYQINAAEFLHTPFAQSYKPEVFAEKVLSVIGMDMGGCS